MEPPQMGRVDDEDVRRQGNRLCAAMEPVLNGREHRSQSVTGASRKDEVPGERLRRWVAIGDR